MTRRLTIWILVLFLLLSPLLSSAQTIDVKEQIATLRARIVELQARLQALAAELSKADTCDLGTRILFLGMRGEDVRCLQRILSKDVSIYPEQLVTGYFGLLTQKALERYQKKVDIVSSGTATTTGFGALGAETRAALKGRRVTSVEVGVAALPGFEEGATVASSSSLFGSF